MTIRIFTSHPALRYVLGRTAPLGATVRLPAHRRSTKPAGVYAIEIESRFAGWKKCREVLCAWLPGHVRQYGADRVEINGRPVGADEAELRRALWAASRGAVDAA